MLHYIYCRPLGIIILFMVLILGIWSILPSFIPKKLWKFGNLVLTILMTTAILYATVFIRSESETESVLVPFVAFAAAKQQPELYREMLMNVFLFFPMGLTLSNALPCRWRMSERITVTVLVGCMLSVGIEFIQYRFALGTAETDDVICNTLGTFVGTLSLIVSYFLKRAVQSAKDAKKGSKKL
jgi:glycopeptide antibiotics resistance protein